MYKYLLIFLMIFSFAKVMAVGPEDAIAASALASEPLLGTAVSLGTDIYNTCILVPPIDPTQQAVCAGKYVTYLTNIQILHVDMFGVNTVMTPGAPDPYILSPYDVCRFDMGNLILFPICGA